MEAGIALGSVGTRGLTSMNMQNKNRVACCDLAFVRAALKYVGRSVGR